MGGGRIGAVVSEAACASQRERGAGRGDAGGGGANARWRHASVSPPHRLRAPPSSPPLSHLHHHALVAVAVVPHQGQVEAFAAGGHGGGGSLFLMKGFFACEQRPARAPCAWSRGSEKKRGTAARWGVARVEGEAASFFFLGGVVMILHSFFPLPAGSPTPSTSIHPPHSPPHTHIVCEREAAPPSQDVALSPRAARARGGRRRERAARPAGQRQGGRRGVGAAQRGREGQGVWGVWGEGGASPRSMCGVFDFSPPPSPQLLITGMHCTSCASAVEGALR